MIALDVHQHVMGLMNLVDRVSQLPAAPILEAMNLPTALLDISAVAVDHGGHLLALAGVHQKNNFVISH
jgi:hypothetical protein